MADAFFIPHVPARVEQVDAINLRQGSGKGERFRRKRIGQGVLVEMEGGALPPKRLLWLESSQASLLNCLYVIDFPIALWGMFTWSGWVKATWLHHRLWMLSKLQPLQRVIFLCFLSCFLLQRTAWSSRNWTWPTTAMCPCRRHLSCHGVLGVEWKHLVSLTCGVSALVAPHTLKSWPLLPASASSLELPGFCGHFFRSRMEILRGFQKRSRWEKCFLSFFVDVSACLVTYYGGGCLIKWWAV